MSRDEVLGSLKTLTPDQLKVLGRLCQNRSVSQIVLDLSITQSRVYQQLKEICRKFGVDHLKMWQRLAFLETMVCPVLPDLQEEVRRQPPVSPIGEAGSETESKDPAEDYESAIDPERPVLVPPGSLVVRMRGGPLVIRNKDRPTPPPPPPYLRLAAALAIVLAALAVFQAGRITSPQPVQPIREEVTKLATVEVTVERRIEVPVTVVVERTALIERIVTATRVTGSPTPLPPTATTVPPSPTTVPPTATPRPKPGDVLYEANWRDGLRGWAGSPDWKPLNEMLLNDGTKDSAFIEGPSITAPYAPSVPDYAIEAEIQNLSVRPTSSSSFGIVARFTGKAGYYLGINVNDAVVLSNAYLLQALVRRQFNPGTAWHTYRAEVRGNTVRLLIDGAPIVTVTDNQFLNPGIVGLWCNSVQINVRSFKMFAM